LPPVEGASLPVGRYTLVANFVLDTQASGVCDSHAVADFDPDTTLPTDRVRTRDPFQGVSKKAFGFTFSVAAATPSEKPSLPGGIRERPSVLVEEPARPSTPADRGDLLLVPGQRPIQLGDQRLGPDHVLLRAAPGDPRPGDQVPKAWGRIAIRLVSLTS
jgi:hypothetical protein